MKPAANRRTDIPGTSYTPGRTSINSRKTTQPITSSATEETEPLLDTDEDKIMHLYDKVVTMQWDRDNKSH